MAPAPRRQASSMVCAAVRAVPRDAHTLPLSSAPAGRHACPWGLREPGEQGPGVCTAAPAPPRCPSASGPTSPPPCPPSPPAELPCLKVPQLQSPGAGQLLKAVSRCFQEPEGRVAGCEGEGKGDPACLGPEPETQAPAERVDPAPVRHTRHPRGSRRRRREN